MSNPKSEDQEYLENLTREIYFDTVNGFLKVKDVSPIIAGAQDYLRIRRRCLAWQRRWSLRWAALVNRWLNLWKRRVCMINGRLITPSQLITDFAARDYVCDETIADAVYLSLVLEKPLLVEGEPGVGKTEIAKVLADLLNTELIRLQCYEGLDENKALYEWNYQKQLLYIQGHERNISDVFAEEFLMMRPLLKAIQSEGQAPVLLIDEIDKADEEFEAFLLEILSDFQVSIPEFGTIKAKTIPHIIITNNDVRELTDALKRRCIYLYIDYPSVGKEEDILRKKVPGILPSLARQVAQLMHALRERTDLLKKPSIAEGIDLARALTMERVNEIDEVVLDRFLPTILKNKQDMAMMRKKGKEKWLGVI